jgi:glycogen synthase
MRVLHLTPEFPPVIWGGLGTAVGGLVTASAKSGITIAVLLVGGVLVIGDGGPPAA